MPRRRQGNRVLGPYPYRGKFRIIVCDEGGARVARLLETEEEAELTKAAIEGQLKAQVGRTIDEAINDYEVHLRDVKQNKPASCTATAWRLRRFFVETDLMLRKLTPERCRKLYEQLATTPSERTGKPLAPDSHRNLLAEAKTFLGWCTTEQRWLKANPLIEVAGRGRRRHGKPQLRIDEAKRLRGLCHELAGEGDDGAVAVLLAMLMGLRAGEIVSRTVRDLDNGGRILWVDDTADGFSPKTEASRRPVPVWSEVQPYLIERASGKKPTALLFPTEEGGGHWRDWVRHQTIRLCRKAKVPEVCAHSLRGFSATLGLLSGIPLAQVAAQLGHESPTTTLQSYAAPGTVETFAMQQVIALLGPVPTRDKAS